MKLTNHNIILLLWGLILSGMSVSVTAQSLTTSDFIMTALDKGHEPIFDVGEGDMEALSQHPAPVAYVPVEFGPGWAEAIWGGATYPTYHIQWGPYLPIDSWITHPVNSQNYLIEFPSAWGWETIYYRVKGETATGEHSEWSNTVELVFP